ncbi:hypothetical protein MMC24_001856 [Lignoscripta atroalba]|nr:hypothetical protein [Lignoscripta atroalba]
MSPGSRLYDRSRQLATDRLLAAPRDPNLFLYPRRFVSTAIRASVAAAKTTTTTTTTTTSALSWPGGNAELSNLKHVCPHTSRSDKVERVPASIRTKVANPPACLDGSIVRKSPGSRFGSTVEGEGSRSLVSGQHELLESAFSRSDGQSSSRRLDWEIGEKFQCAQPVTFRHVLSTIKWKRKRKDDKVFVNSLLRDKGLWSHDWRLPFQILKQHYQDPQLNVPSSTIFRWCLSNPKSRYYQMRADQIPRPAHWSPLTLNNYIEDLTGSTVTRHMHRFIYSEGSSHVAAVTTALHAVFNDPSLRTFLTVRAFNTAMSFFYKHSMVLTARSYFLLMKELQLNIPVDTFNIILKGAASRRDLHNFTSWLRIMIKRGVKPNADTWVALVIAIEARAVKLRIVKEMEEKGMMDRPVIMREIINQLISPEIVSHLESGQHIGSFLQQLDLKHTPTWFTIGAANQLCHHLGEHGLGKEALRMLKRMRARGIVPDTSTMNIFLGHCRLYRDMGRAIYVLRLFQSEYGAPPTKAAYEILFFLAWNLRLLNCCRVVWRAACLEAVVSFRMQKIVMRSLMRNTPEQRQTKTQAWMKTAGKVIVGVYRHRNRLDPELKDVKRLATWANTGVERLHSSELAKRVLACDLQVALHFSLKSNLADLLDKAFKMDQAWRDDIWVNRSILRKVREACGVGLVRKR